MLGSSIAQAWRTRRPDEELVEVTRAEVDLRDRDAVARLIARVRPDAIVHAAARVGGIAAKLAEPTRYLLENVELDSAVIGAAIAADVPELLYIGSAASYPEAAPQPIREAALLTGALEDANEGYGIAKIVGARLCAYASRQYGYAYRTAVPSNLYGPGDDFSASHGHLVAAALGKVHAAHEAGDSSVSVWGDGTARREFTYSPDLAAWVVDQIGLLDAWPPELNLGVGEDHTIAEYYRIAADIVGFTGGLAYDHGKPSGVPARLLDSSAARALGWAPTTSLADGMAATYDSFLTSDRRGAR
jgi:GDP-L-fucose synthase